MASRSQGLSRHRHRVAQAKDRSTNPARDRSTSFDTLRTSPLRALLKALKSVRCGERAMGPSSASLPRTDSGEARRRARQRYSISVPKRIAGRTLPDKQSQEWSFKDEPVGLKPMTSTPLSNPPINRRWRRRLHPRPRPSLVRTAFLNPSLSPVAQARGFFVAALGQKQSTIDSIIHGTWKRLMTSLPWTWIGPTLAQHCLEYRLGPLIPIPLFSCAIGQSYSEG